MSTQVTALAGQLGCSELVAKELTTTGLEVAQDYSRLVDVWDYELLLEAKRKASVMWWENPRDNHGLTYNPELVKERRADKAKRTRRKLSSAAQKLFKQFAFAEAARQKFRLARLMADELSEQSDDELLTIVFEVAHEHRQLPHPEKVVEGRSLYEAMWRDSDLLRNVGAIPQI